MTSTNILWVLLYKVCVCVCVPTCMHACVCTYMYLKKSKRFTMLIIQFLHMHVLSRFCCVWLFVTLWTVTHQAPLSIGFSRCEDWSRMACPPPGDLSDPGIEFTSFMSPALAGVFYATSATWEAHSVPELSLIISVFLVCWEIYIKFSRFQSTIIIISL